jgi:hypothetical protein
VLIAAVAVAAAVGGAWALQAIASGGGESSQGDSPPPYSVKVEQGGEVVKAYDLAALQALPHVAAEMDGNEQTGPLLKALLADAGISSFERVEVRGAAIRDGGRLTLTQSEVGRRVQVDFSERGTVKICAPWLERKEWVRDVLTISVD